MLLTVLIISGTILGATTIAGLLMLYQIRQATNTALSLQALFAADTGLEWRLYQLFAENVVDQDVVENHPIPEMSVESNSDFIVKGDENSSIRSVGCAGAKLDVSEEFCPRPVTRAFELIFK